MTEALCTDPEHIAISKSRGIQIDWKDGHKSDYQLVYLRDHCPCAGCTGAHGTAPRPKTAENPFPLFQPRLKMDAVEPVGNYAIRISWSDGHSAGIYSFAHFRHICGCPGCKPESSRP
jgi:DUF971 family protein